MAFFFLLKFSSYFTTQLVNCVVKHRTTLLYYVKKEKCRIINDANYLLAKLAKNKNIIICLIKNKKDFLLNDEIKLESRSQIFLIL